MTATPQDQPSDQPMGRLLQDTLSHVESLIRAEFRLAKTEVADDARQAGVGGALVVGGGLLGLYAFGTLLNSLVELLEEVMPEWLAGLVVTLTLGAAGAVLAMIGMDRLKQSDLVPRETMGTLGGNVPH